MIQHKNLNSGIGKVVDSIAIDWLGMNKAVVKATWPFIAGAVR